MYSWVKWKIKIVITNKNKIETIFYTNIYFKINFLLKFNLNAHFKPLRTEDIFVFRIEDKEYFVESIEFKMPEVKRNAKNQ